MRASNGGNELNRVMDIFVRWMMRFPLLTHEFSPIQNTGNSVAYLFCAMFCCTQRR